MKPILNVVALVALLCLCGCQNKDIDVETFSIADEQVRPGTDTVGIRGTYDFFMEAEGMKINIGTDSTLSDANSHAVALSGKDYAVTVRHLQPNTTYYYGYSVDLGLKHDFLTETRHFTTLALPPVQEYTVSVEANPTDGGTVAGGGTYTEGQTCAVSAAANEGYTFINWTENDSIVSADSLYRFVVNADRALVAQFEMQIPEPEEYTITVSANPTNGGTVSGGGTYQEGQQCTVTAAANTGYNFINWTENGEQVSANANYTFTVNSNRTLMANFTAQTPQNYTITVSANPTNGGTVTGGGTYQEGQQCTVTATANSGYEFANWTENGNVVSTNANYTFTVNSNRTLVANFTAQTPQNYTISVSANPTNGGTVAGGGTYQQGQSCTVHATANSGYTFTNWTENGNVVSSNANYTFTVTGNRTLVANFTAQPQNYTISVSASPTNGGTVTGGGTYQQGQSCTVSATANTGYTFINWTENGEQVSTNANYTFTVNSNRTLVANFTAQTPQNYTISVSANPTNGGTVTGGGTYQEGQQCTVTATANEGFDFTNWTENGNVVSTNANYTFTVNSNRTLVANFTAQPQNYTIAVSANPSNAGTVSGGGTYQEGQQCTVTATANSGYTFSNWTENGSVVSSNANYTFTVNGNRSLVANFAISGGWLYYDDGVNEDAIGTGGGNFWWGVMFPTGSYYGNMLTKVSAYDYMAMTGTVTIYNDGNNRPIGSAVGQTDVTFTGSEDFVEFEFAEPVVIDPTKNIWVVFYNASGATYPAAVCDNTGDANGRWVSLNGSDWADLAGYGLNYTFMVRAYVTNGSKDYFLTPSNAKMNYGKSQATKHGGNHILSTFNQQNR